jgi:phosphate transport system permease protein
VHSVNAFAETTITFGGLFVILAVLGIFVYLTAQVLPLFTSGSIEPRSVQTLADKPVAPAAALSDEYRRVLLRLEPGGTLRADHIPDGLPIANASIAPAGEQVTAISFEPSKGLLALGLASGKVALGTMSFDVKLLAPQEAPDHARDLPVGSSVIIVPSETYPFGGAVERVSLDQFRRITPVVDLRAPTPLAKEGVSPIVRIDYRSSAAREYLVALRGDGQATFDLVRTTRPLGGGKPRSKLEEYSLPFSPPPGLGLPGWMFVTGDGQSVLALWENGVLQRYATASPERNPPVFAETVELLGPDRRVTSAAMLLGGLTLLVGDDAGNVTRGFPAVDPATKVPGGQRFVVAERMPLHQNPIAAFGLSTRDRTLAVGDRAGSVAVFHATSGKMVLRPTAMGEGRVLAAVLTPKLDGLAVLDETGRLRMDDFDKGYPEASFSSLFGRVHYEGQLSPEFVYQSSTGEDTSEVKYSIVPLISGTLKATFFALLFAVPLAVLGAIFTSEFLSRSTRKVVKPAIEMMASLPSVVLGFLAGIVVAPWVAENLAAVLIAFITLPLGMLTAGFLWQLMPISLIRKIPPLAKVGAMLAVFAGSLGVAASLGPALERSMFVPSDADRWAMAGLVEQVPEDQIPAWVGARPTMSGTERRELRTQGFYFSEGRIVRARPPANDAESAALEQSDRSREAAGGRLTDWLNGNFGDATPGWNLLLVAPAAVIAGLAFRSIAGRRFAELSDGASYGRAAMLDLGRYAILLALTFTLAWTGAHLLGSLGLDSRDLIFGPFSQRNTLVVGLIMGFAIIPIIYTISEDAMNAVPDSLRSASLGSGATPWQTAIRVVLPVAASGIFSAIMIGLGRAVGETMIVVMATGNSPTLDFNAFSGCRTLSANIAVEMPEAVQGDVHYRVLFLCGFVLFVLTFVVNTSAEVVRQRFRRRSAAL